jgi:Mrp family chromosome partitioning ATPase
VIVDAPPLVDVIDALALARMADAVLIVAHLGRTHLRRIKELGELLAGNGIRPAGFALLGVSRPDRSDYYVTTALSGDGTAAQPPTERPVERQPSS